MSQIGGAVRHSNQRQSQHGRDAEFDRLVEEVRARHNISDLVRRYTDLKRAGPREMVGLCVFHKERTPSLRVNDDKGSYYCFGCGVSGDSIRFIMEKEGVGFIQALRFLGATDLPIVDPSERARRREIDAEEQLEARKTAVAFFADAHPVEGTVGERYLRARGIDLMPEFAGSVRFGVIPAWRNPETGEWGRVRPALICVCQAADGKLTGIQRIFLDSDKPDKAAVKLTLGRIRGSALRLGKPQAEVVVTEGPEDGLSLRQMLHGRSVWVACGTGLLPFIDFPPEVETVIIAGQNNAPGRLAVETASAAYVARGLTVKIIYPEPAFDDWNDELRGVLA